MSAGGRGGGRRKKVLRLPGREIFFPRRPLVMGIVNINDDSFSGDGTLDVGKAIEMARGMVEAGADMIDVGAESARTNRGAIAEEEELRRLVPFLERWEEVFVGVERRDAAQVFPPVLSVNTWRTKVIEEVLRRGVELLNDMSGLVDARHAELCAQERCALLVMHTVGLPKEDHSYVRHEDIVGGVREFFRKRVEAARGVGLGVESLVLDPGIGFAKQASDDLELLRRVGEWEEFGCLVLLPVSRKSVIKAVLGLLDPRDRDAGTVACVVGGAMRGGEIFRVHDVGAVWAALKVLEEIGEVC